MNRLVTKLAKFSALSWPERRTLLAAMAWLPLFWLGLRALGLHRLQACLQRGNPPAASTLARDDITRMATLVNMAAAQPWVPATCLTRSLLLSWLLRRRGIATQLRIGVRMNQGALDAHAWVEYAGRPINDAPDVGEQFASFPDLPPLGSFDAP